MIELESWLSRVQEAAGDLQNNLIAPMIMRASRAMVFWQPSLKTDQAAMLLRWSDRPASKETQAVGDSCLVPALILLLEVLAGRDTLQQPLVLPVCTCSLVPTLLIWLEIAQIKAWAGEQHWRLSLASCSGRHLRPPTCKKSWAQPDKHLLRPARRHSRLMPPAGSCSRMLQWLSGGPRALLIAFSITPSFFSLCCQEFHAVAPFHKPDILPAVWAT